MNDGGIEGVPSPAPEMAARLAAVQSATKTWTGQLVDLTGRNNLLYFKDLKVGTLPLDTVSPQPVHQCLAGKTVQVTGLFPVGEPRDDAVKRARSVHNKSKANYEERGIATLHLACGMASWSGGKSASVPAAPVLLVPVQLLPKGAAQEQFDLMVTGELEVNPTLLQMLKAEFSVDCDPADLLADSGIEGIIDTPEELEASYAWLANECRSVPDFQIAPRFVIGNFSYARMPMVRDLENSAEAMAEHDIVAALAGDPSAQELLRNAGTSTEIPTPDSVPPADEFLVLDADSSQNYVINAVLAGRNLIIKGPPGTGKSQTISNLVSTLVARGKRVLFVAEKRAAIDAVLRRLGDVGLGDLVLDLHGGVASRKQTAQALAAALKTNARLAKPDLSAVHRLLAQRRDELNRRVEELHRPREPWQISFFEMQSRLLGLPEEARSEVRFSGEELQRLGEDEIREIDEELKQFVGLGGLTVRHSDSPWGQASVTSNEQAEQLVAEARSLRQQLPLVLAQLRDAAGAVATGQPVPVRGWSARIELWNRIAEFRQRFTEEIFALDLPKLIEDLEPAAGSVAARATATIFSGEYRDAKKSIRACVAEGHEAETAELHSGALECEGLLATWRKLGGDPGSVPRAPEGHGEIGATFDAVLQQLEALEATVKIGLTSGDEVSTCQLLDQLLADIPTLSKLPEIHRLETTLRSAGATDLLAGMDGQPLSPGSASEILRWVWLESLIEHLQLSELSLGAFDGDRHREVVEDFQSADHEHIETTPQRVRRLCAEQAVRAQDEHQSDAALVQSEAAKKRRHLPIRQLFSAAPEVLTSLKPCWAMSPLVVSQVLPSDAPHFDVVVFDEASQVRPADAMPAILRGRQLVVAGDEKQLPPTSFFAGSGLGEDEEAEVGQVSLAVDASYESILEALQAFVGFQMLEWHYRSRDERLIAFSNFHLYDRGLTTFPGVSGPDCVQHVLVPFVPGEPGSEASSAAEVEAVVQLVIEHAEARPEQSLGVIAMGLKHADRIEEALRQALRGREDLDEFFQEDRHEPFFVKNLERVQGDERDAIILSVGYGKSPDGRLMYRFGPLNQEGGERRLNVAVTRAKERMTLVSSFSHHDMDPERTTARGVEMLRAYIEYCTGNGSDLGPAAAQIPQLNPFESDVRDHLERARIPLVGQFGVSGYRIDFAAKHPHQPGRMVLAIECDGASYHSSESARDRDRLRQEQLERLGWTFHRIWSQDWFNHRDREIARAKEAYDAAVVAADRADEAGHLAPEDEFGSDEHLETTPTLADLVEVPERGPCPIVTGRPVISDYRPAELIDLIRWIESDTLPRTEATLMDEAIKALGFKRQGKNIVTALNLAIDSARAKDAQPPG